MTTENRVQNTTIPAKPIVSRRRRIFARTFGIPGLIFAIISMWFTVAESVVAMTASGVAEAITRKVMNLSLADIMSIPVMALCVAALVWAMFAIALCALSRFLGTSSKLSQTGLILSVVSVICSLSLACFSIIYMILA